MKTLFSKKGTFTSTQSGNSVYLLEGHRVVHGMPDVMLLALHYVPLASSVLQLLPSSISIDKVPFFSSIAQGRQSTVHFCSTKLLPATKAES